MIAYHFVADTLRDGRPIPADGEWLVHDGDVVICETGLHASKHPYDALQYAPGPTLCLVECEDIVTEHDDKFACRRRRIVKRFDATDTMRAFARHCALSVIHLWDAPEVVRRYLETGDESLRAAARDAAGAAARAAARAAAGAAAMAAAWDAAGDAAGAAAGDAARAAARDAAGAAAGAAARAAAWDAAGAAAGDAARAAARAAAWDAAGAAAGAAARAAAWDAAGAAAGDAARAAARAAARDAARDAHKTKFAEMVGAKFAEQSA